MLSKRWPFLWFVKSKRYLMKFNFQFTRPWLLLTVNPICKMLAVSLTNSRSSNISDFFKSFSSFYTKNNKRWLDYMTIQRMTIPRLTKWRPDFDILMIQQLFFLKKKRPKNFSYPSQVSLKDFSYPSRVPETTYTTPHGVFLPLAGADF